MDFDPSKENIQPLRDSRNAQQLEMAMQAQANREHQVELTLQKEEFENLIRTYAGDDPLENYYNYISWVEQTYPKHGHEGNLIPLLERCLALFENDKRYTNDRRFCKLWIKYFDLQPNPLELYHLLRDRGLCSGCADFYKAWAYYYEVAGDFKSANNVFEDGKRNAAEPYEELVNAQQNLVIAVGQNVLFGPDKNKLMEKRQALISLHTYKPGRVGLVQVPSGNSVVTSSATSSTASISVYEDRGNEAAAVDEHGTQSLVAAAKHKKEENENALKPAPWTTLHAKKGAAAAKTRLQFTVLKDTDSRKGIKLLGDRPRETQEDYSGWIVSIKYPEPPNPNMIPMYPKDRVYKDLNTEYSIEELRASRYWRNVACGRRSERTSVRCQIDEIISIREDVEIMQESPIEFPCGKNEDTVKHTVPTDVPLQDAIPEIDPSFHFNVFQHGVEQNSFLQATNQHHLMNRESGQVDEPPEFTIWGDVTPDVIEVFNSSVPRKTFKFSTNNEDDGPMKIKADVPNAVFRDLKAEDRRATETGWRDGMDLSGVAQGMGGTKQMPLFSDNSSSLFDDIATINPDRCPELEVSCDTQMFGFNLNDMQVSTPQNKRTISCNAVEEDEQTKKHIFTEPKEIERYKALSTIYEETKYDGASSSSSGHSVFSSHSNKMDTVPEEHNRYLTQNLMANAALRSSLLGDFMEIGAPQSPNEQMALLPGPSLPVSKRRSPSRSPDRRISSTTVVQPLDVAPSDPFTPSVINTLLERVKFPGPHVYGCITLETNPKICVRKEPTLIGNNTFIVEKQLGKGTFGTVFKAYDVSKNKAVALKLQKPPNRWEFYVCRELQARLNNHPLRENFMDVSIGYFADQVSILVSNYMPGGSLLDLANSYKLKFGRTMKESLVVYFTIEMLKIVQAMHEAKIIHGDIKPDNLLILVRPDDTATLQLIDFGCSIDMTLFPAHTTFTRKVTTEGFICCEMLDGRAWNYHTDLFCVAATTHVLLFDTYMKLKRDNRVWSITQRFPRYVRAELWMAFFNNLLNQQTGLADTNYLVNMLNDCLNKKDVSIEMRHIYNLVKKR